MTFTTSTQILPPILEYSYPSFKYSDRLHDFIIKMSVVNDYEDFEFIEIRIIVSTSNDEGFNPRNDKVKLLDPRYYFARVYKKENLSADQAFGTFEKTLPEEKYSADSQLTIHLKSYDLTDPMTDTGIGSIFNIYNNDIPSPTNFKMQCRLGKALTGTDNYSVSEWSNSSIIRVNNGITIDLTPKDLTLADQVTVTQSSILWNGIFEALGSSNLDEVVNQYNFSLYKNDSLLEESGDIAMGAYDLPNYQYRFRTPLENTTVNGITTPYTLIFKVETNYGYVGTAIKTVYVDIPYQRTYDIFSVAANDDEAYNSITIDAKEGYVRKSAGMVEDSNSYIREADVAKYFRQDNAMHTYEPLATYTHLEIVPDIPSIGADETGKLIPDYDDKKSGSKFQTSDDASLSIILAITKIKTYATREEAMSPTNLLFRINNSADVKTDKTTEEINSTTGSAISSSNLDIKVGAYCSSTTSNNGYLLIEESLYGLKNIYTFNLSTLGAQDSELYLVIKKRTDNGDLLIQAIKGTTAWITNNFVARTA